MVTTDLIKSEYPLHWLVWNNSYRDLQQELSKNIVSTFLSVEIL